MNDDDEIYKACATCTAFIPVRKTAGYCLVQYVLWKEKDCGNVGAISKSICADDGGCTYYTPKQQLL